MGQSRRNERNGRVRRAAKPVGPRRIEGVVERIGAQGDGVLISSDGPVFVPLTAPGDVGVFDARGDRGEIVNLTSKSSVRTTPSCALFGRCGGCALQHIDRDAYLAWKRARVVEALARAGVGEGDCDRHRSGAAGDPSTGRVYSSKNRRRDYARL